MVATILAVKVSAIRVINEKRKKCLQNVQAFKMMDK